MLKLSFQKLSLAPLLFLLLFLTPVPITSAFATSPSGITKTKSSGLAGYEIATPSDTITLVQGSWVVPTVTCKVGETTFSRYLVGIQGDDGGADFLCSSGSAVYSPDCEFLSIDTGCTGISGGDKVSPGDKMTSVSTENYVTHTATVTLTDTTKAWTYAHTFTDARSLIEGFWVLEGDSPLTKFTLLKTSGNLATIGSKHGSLASFSPSYPITRYELVNGADVLATTSSLSGTTSAFSIKWLKAS